MIGQGCKHSGIDLKTDTCSGISKAHLFPLQPRHRKGTEKSLEFFEDVNGRHTTNKMPLGEIQETEGVTGAGYTSWE